MCQRIVASELVLATFLATRCRERALFDFGRLGEASESRRLNGFSSWIALHKRHGSIC